MSEQDDDVRSLEDVAARVLPRPHDRLRDLAKRIIAYSEIFADIPWSEATETNFFFREPLVARINMGVIRRLSVVSIAKAKGSGDETKFRKSEESVVIKGMASEFIRQLFYGDSAANPRELMGLSSFYNTLDRERAQNAVNVISAGGDGGSSIWLINWAGIHVAYPKHSVLGLIFEDIGDDLQAITDESAWRSAGSGMLVSLFGMTAALVPKDWRHVARIANIQDDSDLLGLISQAAFCIPFLDKQHCAFYVGRKIWRALGKEKSLRGLPIRVIDELRADEARVE